MYDPEDILSASLESLYGFSPITFSTPGSVFNYDRAQIELATPDTAPSNWSLHASSIWVSSLYIADHVHELGIARRDSTVHVLELGAGAGLPSILIARIYGHLDLSVTATDYPDDALIRTLADNVRRNGVAPESCRVVPYAWGSDTAVLRGARDRHGPHDARFDVVFAADTLWNPELHEAFLDTLCRCLRRDPAARVHLVAGLHTGRYTIQAFLDRTPSRGLVVECATEREVGGTGTRPWDVSRAEGEDERERRRWVVWIILMW